MSPVLTDGEPVRVRRRAAYWPGDVVAYYCPHRDTYFIHRLLGFVRAGGARKCLVMADHAARPDTLVDYACILGRLTTIGGAIHPVKSATRVLSLLRYARWSLWLILDAYLRHRKTLPVREST